jgi:HNH endonuclease
MIDLFGVKTVEGYDPDDEPGPQGISFNELKQWVTCDPENGLAWRIRDSINPYNGALNAKAGDSLGSNSSINGYQNIKLSNIIWVFAHDGIWVWPPNIVDHIDGNRRNNKISNLREATPQQNVINRKIQRNNRHGIPGIHWKQHRNQWLAVITIDNRHIILGYFTKLEDAINARHAAEDKYFGEFAARHSRPDYFDGTKIIQPKIKKQRNQGKIKDFIDSILTKETDECISLPFKRKIYTSVSRYVCQRAYGPRPTPKMEAAHSCGNGKIGCVNWKHLRWATRLENSIDSIVDGTHNTVKLTTKDVTKIRRLGGTMTNTDIGKMFGVTRTAIYEILAHKTWKWVEDEEFQYKGPDLFA